MVDAMTSLRTVPAFYRDREIFVTGATGYLGKVLVEKLLRSCPDIGRIFVLVRPKRGQVPAERLKAFLEDDVFKRLRKENAAQLQKLVVISGDVRELGLSISAVDIERLRDVSVIIHSAGRRRERWIYMNPLIVVLLFGLIKLFRQYSCEWVHWQ